MRSSVEWSSTDIKPLKSSSELTRVGGSVRKRLRPSAITIGGGFAEIVAFRQSATERNAAAVGRGYGFLAIAAQGREDVGDMCGTIQRNHSERVTGLVIQTGSCETELNVVNLLAGTWSV